jgi:hypothetical protein
MVGDAGEHIGDIMLRVESVELGAFDQRIDRGDAAAAGIGAGKQVILAANSNRPFILPMSGRRSRSIIAGTHFMAVAFDAIMSSGAPVARLFTSSWRPAWSLWWRHGRWIPPPALEWNSVHRASRYQPWLSCISY